jgi:hypothetical protein
MAQPNVCGECGNVVPYGRLSCPECGELLASVAGAGRRASTNGLAGADVATASPPPSTWPTPVDELADGLEFDDDDGLEFHDGHEPDDGLPSVAAAPIATVGSMPVAASAGPAVGASSGVVAASYTSPGAYVPPVLQPAGPVAPARAWAGHAGEGGTNGLNGTAMAAVTAGTAGTAAEGTAERDGKASLVDAAAAVEFVGWLAIAGAALATAGFLLPWSVSVIGAGGVGYFDRWGFAGPGHILMVVGLLGVLAAAILRERVPIWLGIGVPGLGLGALLVGLVWPYVFGPLGAQLGALAVALGAVMLVVAGIAALIVDRHVEGDEVV